MCLMGYDVKYTDSKPWSNTCGIYQARIFQIAQYFSCRTVYSYKHGSKTLSTQEGRPGWCPLSSHSFTVATRPRR